jgi:TolB protein
MRPSALRRAATHLLLVASGGFGLFVVGCDRSPVDVAPGATARIAFLEERPDSGGVQLSIINADGTGIRGVTPANEYVYQYDWSPDGRHAAYSLQDEPGIHVTDPDSMSHRTIAAEVAIAPVSHIKWSPDGRKILFRSEGELDEGVYVVNADGTGLHDLSAIAGHAGFPEWSPDGERIVFMRSAPDVGSALWIAQANGSGAFRLPLPGYAAHPRWSPDGKKIAYDDGYAIWLVNPDGTNARALTRLCPPRTICDAPAFEHPRWSHDGKRLLAHEYYSRSVVVMDAAGSSIRSAAPLMEFDEFPDAQWSPDGGSIVFVSRESGRQDLYTMRADFSKLARITRAQRRNYAPCWVR